MIKRCSRGSRLSAADLVMPSFRDSRSAWR